MDIKEVGFHEDRINVGLSEQSATDDMKYSEERIDMCCVNKGFEESNSSKEDLTNKIEMESENISNNVIISDASRKTQQDGYVNNAFEDGPQKSTDKGTLVPLAHDSTVITSATLENQITKLDEDNNGVVAVNLETKEKKRKIQSVGWDTKRSIIFFGLILAFDVWAIIFCCFKTNILTDILN